MNMKKLTALLLALVMVFALAACGGEPAPVPTDAPPTGTPEPTAEPVPALTVADLTEMEYGTDYIALYEHLGKEVTIEDVIEDPDTGLAYIEVDGERLELGMDFLSMAMVYNTEVPDGSSYASTNDVYAAWWKLYIQRWNYLVPELPLYSNEYYDFYNTEITGVAENPTNPYWSPSDALIDWGSEKANADIIIGNTTELSGKFRFANFGSSNPGAADLDIQGMTNSFDTVATTKEGNYEWNETVVESHEETENEDGSKTFTIKLHEDLLFSDGSPITAKNYLVWTLVFSTPVAAQAASKDHMAGLSVVGFNEHNVYTGQEGSEGTAAFSGLRLIDDYTFSVTIAPDYLPYFYDITYGTFTPYDLELWIGDNDIVDDGEGAYITEGFYAMTGDSYDLAAHITASSLNTDDAYPYAGPYMVSVYDNTDKSVILTRNPYYKGNYEGVIPAIEQVTYKKIVSETQLDDFIAGGVDILAGVTGGDATNEAITLADGSDGKYGYIHYSRAGYGKLGFRGDYGPAQYTEVRQAIAYCVDRAQFAKDFTGGFGGVTDGPYYTGSWMYQAAVAQGMTLNAYSTSADSAIAVLEAGGWVYDQDGNAYESGVRYKQIPADKASENDINYQSKDGAYKTTKVGDFYYMPLALNWYGTTENEFTDQLVTGFMENPNMTAAGFVVQNSTGTFQVMLDELYQEAVYGYYAGSPMYSCFNFATGFTSTVYDYSYNWTIDPGMYDNYSICYVKDLADVYLLG